MALPVECGDEYQVRNAGAPLQTLNNYMPPSYIADGEELQRGKEQPGAPAVENDALLRVEALSPWG